MNPNWAVIGGTVGQEPIAGQEEKEKKMSPIGRLSVGAVGQEQTAGQEGKKMSEPYLGYCQVGAPNLTRARRA
jgi:hypothetical protein